MTQLTIPNIASQVKYAVTSSTTGPFVVPFPFMEEGDVKAAVIDTAGVITYLVLTTNFIFSALDTPSGQEGSGYESGQITLVSAIGSDADSEILIYRDTVIDRLANLLSTGPFSVPSLNDDLNHHITILQEFAEVLNRALVHPRDDSLGLTYDAEGRRITDVLDPTAAQDAATRAYVLAQIASWTAATLDSGVPMTIDTFTGDDSTVAFVISVTPTSINGLIATIDGVMQTPVTDFTLAGSTVTFVTAPPDASDIVIRNFGNAMDEISTGVQTLGNDATPTVAGGSKYVTGGTTTITDFDDGVEAQEITVMSDHAITITHGTNIFLDASVNFVMADGDSLTLVQKADGLWYEKCRMTA